MFMNLENEVKCCWILKLLELSEGHPMEEDNTQTQQDSLLSSKENLSANISSVRNRKRSK